LASSTLLAPAAFFRRSKLTFKEAGKTETIDKLFRVGNKSDRRMTASAMW